MYRHRLHSQRLRVIAPMSLLLFLAALWSCSSSRDGPVANGGDVEAAPDAGPTREAAGGEPAPDREGPRYDPPATLAVLGLRSATNEEEMARELTSALRRVAGGGRSSGLVVSEVEGELTSLMMVYGCGEPDPRCLDQISEALGADYFIFGLVEPESGRSDAGYLVTLSFYNARRNEVERTLQEIIPQGASAWEIEAQARQFYTALTGVPLPETTAEP